MIKIINFLPNLLKWKNNRRLCLGKRFCRITLISYLTYLGSKKWNFYILIMDEKVLVLCEKLLPKFSSNLHVLRPPKSEKVVFTKVSVFLSVVGRILDNSRWNLIRLNWAQADFIGAEKVRTSSLTIHIQPNLRKIDHFLCFWKNQEL